MKGFTRENQLFSLCGLNCGLCPMKESYSICPGCGCGEGNQACGIARCSLTHGGIQYCYECEEYPCDRYEGIDESDSFISHRNQIRDMNSAKRDGIDAYNARQTEKVEILKYLLEHYNDGRKKTFYFQAVNLFALEDIRQIMKKLPENTELEQLDLKKKADYVSGLFKEMAIEKGIELKLRKKNKDK